MILFALWFFLPAGLANASPLIANKLSFLDKYKTPLDFGKTWHGKRIFGDNKTWRGLLFGIFIGVMTVWLQQFLYSGFGWIQTISQDINYNTVNPLILGSLLGAGAMLGDAAESFIKRQMDVAPGDSWFPFDQLDYIVGGLLLGSIAVVLSWQQYAVITIIWFSLHLISVYIGFLIGVRDKPV